MAASSWLYRLFGVNVASDRPLSQTLDRADGPAELTLTWQSGPRPWLVPSAASAVFMSPRRTRDGESSVSLFRRSAGELLHFAEAGEFLLHGDRIEIWAPAETVVAAELCLLGPVLAYWLERQGILALHASAVATPAGAVAFLGAHGAGKSSAAAAMLALGHPLLSDDIVPLEVGPAGVVVRPAYPQMRLRDDLARATFPGAELPPLYPGSVKRRASVVGSFHRESLTLGRLYLLARRPAAEGGVLISPLPRHGAAVELIRHSFSPRLVAAVGLEPARLSRIAELVQRVPVRRLTYPSGYEALRYVAEAVLADI